MTRRLLVILLVAILTGCKRVPSAADIHLEDTTELASAFGMGDPPAAAQMLHGLYSLEGGTWRWSSGAFGFALGVPAGASQLELQFTLPDAVLSQVGPVTVSASINGQTLEAETFDTEGEHVYSKAVALSKPSAVVEFHTDKTLKLDRELALIVTRVGLVAK